jgi:hypothetical protein
MFHQYVLPSDPLVLQEPSLKDVPSELLQLQQDMAVDDVSVAMLLTQPAAMELCGVVTQDDYGQPVFDFAVSDKGVEYDIFVRQLVVVGPRSSCR